MKHKCPYSFPLRSRKAMIDYLAAHKSYSGWNHPTRGWSPLAWNVKLHMRLDQSGKKAGKTTDALDADWENYLAGEGQEMFNDIIEEMQRPYVDGEYTTYPGEDQRDWQFTFAGRSGGHMLLTRWKDQDFLKGFSDVAAWEDWLAALGFYDLQRLYRAVACMDQDFTPEKIANEFAYQAHARRVAWEEEQFIKQVFAKARQGLEPCPQI